MSKTWQHYSELSPFAITTDKGHFVVLQCRDEEHASIRYNEEESHRGNITSIERVA